MRIALLLALVVGCGDEDTTIRGADAVVYRGDEIEVIRTPYGCFARDWRVEDGPLAPVSCEPIDTDYGDVDTITVTAGDGRRCVIATQAGMPGVGVWCQEGF